MLKIRLTNASLDIYPFNIAVIDSNINNATKVPIEGREIKGQIGFDMHGQLVFHEIDDYVNPDLLKKKFNHEINKSFDNCDFITISKEDAQALYANSILAAQLTIKDNNLKEYFNCLEVLGENGAAAERIKDALDGKLY